MINWFINFKKQIIIVAIVLVIATAIVIPVVLTSNTKVIVEGPKAELTITNPDVPRTGEVYVVGTLEEEIQNYGYDNAYFHIEVCLHFDISDRFTYKGKTMDEWRADPILDLYDDVRELWITEIYEPLDKEMMAAEERGEEHALGWWKHSEGELFEEYWYETQTDDVIEAYEEAWEKLDKARRAYDLWQFSEEPTKIFNELSQAEIERLVELGIDLEVVYNNNCSYPVVYPEGYLTRRQIEEFPASDEFGYRIKWANKNNADMSD